MGCSMPGSSVHGDSPDKNTGVGCQALVQGIFPTQELNPGLSHYREILYHLSHQGSQKQKQHSVLIKSNKLNHRLANPPERTSETVMKKQDEVRKKFS